MKNEKIVGYLPIEQNQSETVLAILDELKLSRTVENKAKITSMSLNIGLNFLPLAFGMIQGLAEEFPELTLSEDRPEPIKPTVPYRCPSCGVRVEPRPDKVLVCNCKVWEQ